MKKIRCPEGHTHITNMIFIKYSILHDIHINTSTIFIYSDTGYVLP